MTSDTLYNVQQWYNNRHIATIAWQKPRTLARYIRFVAQNDPKYPRGTIFVLSSNTSRGKMESQAGIIGLK